MMFYYHQNGVSLFWDMFFRRVVSPKLNSFALSYVFLIGAYYRFIDDNYGYYKLQRSSEIFVKANEVVDFVLNTVILTTKSIL